MSVYIYTIAQVRYGVNLFLIHITLPVATIERSHQST